MTKTAICLVSGGIDSCVAAAIAKDLGFELAFLHIQYGQLTYKRELKAFNEIADYYRVKYRLVVDASYFKQIGASKLVDEKSEEPIMLTPIGQISNFYVPFRNANFLAIAVSWAEAINADKIVYGAIKSAMPDSNPAFIEAFNRLIKYGSKVGVESQDLEVIAPLVELEKWEVIKKGIEFGAPLHLTWSCYVAEEVACGRCDACASRLTGFMLAGYEDPIPYELNL